MPDLRKTVKVKWNPNQEGDFNVKTYYNKLTDKELEDT